MKKYTKKQLIEAITYWSSVLESMDAITLDEVDKSAALKLLDVIEKEHLFSVSHFEPERIINSNYDYRFFVGYLGEKTPENITAIISIEPNNPGSGYFYVDQITGVKKGYGVKTLQALLNKNSKWRHRKIWWLASPGYDSATDSYYENEKLNQQYRKFQGVKEIRVERSPWKCAASWFYTDNCGNVIANQIKNGEYF